jgi:hypothetical protein
MVDYKSEMVLAAQCSVALGLSLAVTAQGIFYGDKIFNKSKKRGTGDLRSSFGP